MEFVAYNTIQHTKQHSNSSTEPKKRKIKGFISKHLPAIKIKKWYSDSQNAGFSDDQKTQFHQMLTDLEQNDDIDGIICHNLADLSLSIKETLALFDTLKNMDKHLITIEGIAINTLTKEGRTVFRTYRDLLSFEHSVITDRLQRGRTHAQQHGVKLGRTPIDLDEERIARLYQQGLGCTSISKLMNASKSTIYNRVRRLEQENKLKIRRRG